MSATLQKRQRDELCRQLRAVSPDAPTLCAGWDAYDLAFHIWSLNRDPVAWPGYVLSRFEGLSARRAARSRERRSYEDLVSAIESGTAKLVCMPLDVTEDYRHSLGEYFVHTEDVRRANLPGGLPAGADRYPPELQEALWLRLQRAAGGLGLPGGTVLRAPGADGPGLGAGSTGGREVRCGSGDGPVVRGAPSELMLWAYGRRDVAEVTVDVQ